MMRIFHWILPVFVLAFVLSGCAEKGPIFLTLGYQMPSEKSDAVSGTVVAVAPFRDGRSGQASVLGKRTIPSGQSNDLVVQGTVADTATAVMKAALTARGIQVKDAAPWNLSADGIMKSDGAALLLGGEIKELWLESSAASLNTHLQATVRFRIVAGDLSEKKIIRSIEVSSKMGQDILYSRERLEAMLSEAVSTAIDQIFMDDELKKRL